MDSILNKMHVKDDSDGSLVKQQQQHQRQPMLPNQILYKNKTFIQPNHKQHLIV